MPDIPQSEIAATDFDGRAKELSEELGEILDEHFWGIFVLHVLSRMTHQNFFPNSSQFITPCLVTAPVVEISKFHLHELLRLGVPKESCVSRCFTLHFHSLA